VAASCACEPRGIVDGGEEPLLGDALRGPSRTVDGRRPPHDPGPPPGTPGPALEAACRGRRGVSADRESPSSPMLSDSVLSCPVDGEDARRKATDGRSSCPWAVAWLRIAADAIARERLPWPRRWPGRVPVMVAGWAAGGRGGRQSSSCWSGCAAAPSFGLRPRLRSALSPADISVAQCRAVIRDARSGRHAPWAVGGGGAGRVAAEATFGPGSPRTLPPTAQHGPSHRRDAEAARVRRGGTHVAQ